MYDSSIAEELRQLPARLTLDGTKYVYAGCHLYNERASYDLTLAYAHKDDGIGIQTCTADGDTVIVMHYVPADSDTTTSSSASTDGADVQDIPYGSYVDEYGILTPEERQSTIALVDADTADGLTNIGNGLYTASIGSNSAQCVIARDANVSIDGTQYAYDGCRVISSGDGNALASAEEYATSGNDIGIILDNGTWTVVMRYVPAQEQALQG